MSDILLSVGLQKGSAEVSQIQTDLQNIISRIDKNPPKVKVGLQVDQSAINHFKSQLTQIVNSVGLSKGAPITVNISGIGEITTKAGQAKKALDGVAKAGKEAAAAVNNMGTTQAQKALTQINSQLKTIQSNYAKWTAAATGQSSASYAEYGNQIRALEALKLQVEANVISWTEFQERLGAIKLAASEAATAINKVGENRSAEKVTVLEHNTEEYRKALAQCNSELVNLRKNQEQWTAAKNGRGASDYAALGQYEKQVESLIADLSTGKMTMDEFKQRFGAIKASADNSRAAIRGFGEDTKSLGDRLKGLADKFGAWLSVSQVIMQAIRAIKQMVSAVREVDAAMTELKKVTNESDATYNKFLDKACTRARELGASVSDVVNATADFARLGYGIEDASALADTALVYKNIGDGIEDVTQASESIISTMQAFGIEASGAMSIVDKFNEVGNNFAISSAGIGEAMQRSAAAMAAANNTIDETIALITAANTIVQNPESVGTSLKTVSMYLRAAKTEAEEAGESTDGMASSVSELRQSILKLTGQRVDIQIDENTFKSTYQILKELSEVWDSLTDISQANLLEMIGGKRNANVVSALLENFTIAEEAMQSSMASFGSAVKENEKHLDSINGKVELFKASFQALSTTLIDSELVKGIVDFGTGLLDVLNGIAKFIEKIGGLTTVLLALGAVLLITKGGLIAFTIVTKITSLFAALKNGIMAVVQIIPNAITAWRAYQAGVVSANTAIQASIPILGLLLAAITLVSVGMSAYNSSQEETIANEEELAQKHKETTKAAMDEADAIDSIRDEYLAIIDSSGSYTDKLQSLHEWQSKIIAQYGLEEDAIRKVNLAREDGIQILDAEILRKKREAIAEATAGYQDAYNTLHADTYHSAIGAIEGTEAVYEKYQDLLEKYGYITVNNDGITTNKTGPLWNILNQSDLSSAYDALVDYVNKYSNCLDTLSEEDRAFYDVAAEYLAAISETYRSASAIVEQYDHMVAEADFLEEKHMFGYVHTQADYDALLQRLRQRAWDKWDSETDFKMFTELLDGTVVQYGGAYEDLLVTILQEYYPQFAKASDFVMNNAKKSNALLVRNLAETLNTTEQIIKDSFTDEEITLGAQLVGKGDISSVEELRAAITEYNSDAAVAARRTEALRGVIDMLWSSEGFESAREELTGIVKQYGKISPEKIVELAEESDLLASILKEDGMNARFLAHVLSSLASGGDGLAIITTNALKLNDALNGMSDAFYGVTEAKEKYDAAMQTPEKDESFKSYADAYKTLMEQFEAGTTNSNAFWASAEYLFGAEQLAEWGYADGLTEIKSAAEGLGLVFADADSAGAGLIHKLYAMYEAGKLVNEEGEQLMTISKDAEGGFVFDVDPSNLPAIAENLNITEDALVACFQALSMWGNVDFYDINEVMTAIEEIGLAAETTGGKAINVSRLTEQLLSLGLTNKEIYDVLQKLQALDGVTLFGVTEDVDKLKGELIDLGLAADDGVTVNVDYEGLTNLMSQLGFTKEEAQETINLLGAADGITLTNASGEVKSVDDALAHIDTLTFTNVTENVNTIGDAVEDVDGSSTDNATSEIDAIGTAAETAAQKVYRIGDAMDYINGKTTTVYYEVKRKGTILDIFGFANGTSSAPGGPAVVGEEGAELQITDGAARIVGANGPEIVNVNKGDRIYTAEETQAILRRSGRNIHGIIPAYANGKVSGSIPDIPVPDTDAWKDGGKNSGKNSSSNSSKDDEETWFERQYKDHKHWLEMDKESTEDYLKWLDGAYKQAYEEGIIDIDEYYKYQEEVYKGSQDLFKDYLNDIDHEVSLLDGAAGSSDEVIALVSKAMAEIEKELDAARAAGLDENGDYIQYLEKQWSEYSQTVIDLREQAESESESTIDDLVEYRIDMLKKEIEVEKEALEEKLSDLQDFYDKQRKMMQDQYDEEKYLEEQKEKRKSVTDIQSELAMLENDDSAWAQKRKLELQADLADAEKELSDFERDYALDMTLDMLDEQQAAQEAQIQAQMDALDEKLNDPHALFNQALEDIKNNTAELYLAFIEYNRKYGDGRDSTVEDMWRDAYIADLEYQDTHDGKHQDGIAIGNYTGYVPKAPPSPPENAYSNAANTPAETVQKSEPDRIYPYGLASDTSGDIGSGASGTSVKAIQYALNELGFGNSGTMDCDGEFGIGTRNAVIAFQSAMGIAADGIVGKNTREKFKSQGYSSGTRYATPGIHEIEELGTEYIFESPSDGTRYRMFQGGEKVLTAEATNFLYEFASSGGSVLTKMLSDLLNLTGVGNINRPVQAIQLSTGDININGNADTRTVSEIRRAQRENIEFVIKEFNKLNK